MLVGMAEWSFLTNHAQALLCIAHDPGARLIDIAAALGITERSAYAIVNDLANAGYVVKAEGRSAQPVRGAESSAPAGAGHPICDGGRGPGGANRRRRRGSAGGPARVAGRGVR